MSDTLPQAARDLLATHPFSVVVDARGLLCPLPVLRLAKSVRDMPACQSFLLVATDKMARRDVPALCAEKSWRCAPVAADSPDILFLVRTG